MVGRRGEAPLVPPYSFSRPTKATAAAVVAHGLEKRDYNTHALAYAAGWCEDRLSQDHLTTGSVG